MRQLALVVLGVCVGAGCKSKTAAPVKRTRPAPAVEYVTQPTPAAVPNQPAATPAVPVGKLAATGVRAAEAEPNNDPKSAQALAAPMLVAGTLSDATDVDMYAFTVDKPSVVAFTAVSAGDLVVELRDGAGTIVAKSDRGGNAVAEGVPNFPVAKGRYVIAVKAFRKAEPAKSKTAKPSNPKPAETAAVGVSAPPASAVPYELQATLTATGATATTGVELEPNLDAGTANDLFIGEAATGYLGWTGDVDVWKLSVEGLAARNALDFELSAVEGVTPTITILDAVGRPLAQRAGSKGRMLAIRNVVPVVGTNVPPFFFVAVSAERSNPQLAYRLSVVARVLGGNEELEPNDGNLTAQPLQLGQKIAASWQLGDADSFVIAAEPISRRVTISITPTQGADLVGEVLVANQAVVEFNHHGNGGSETVDVDLPAGAETFVHVHGNPKRKPVEGPYEIAVELAHGDPMPTEQR